jgi:tRNA pseudouridine38-40 synthase
MPAREIVSALNGNLPEDIVIRAADDVPPNFHAQFSAKRKTYRYTILHRKTRGAIQRNFCWHYPYKLNLILMRQEAKALIGKKDFRAFMASDPNEKGKEKDTVRVIYAVKITKKKDYLWIDITANGFLYKMVRNIVGTLVDIANGRRPPGSIKSLLKKKNRTLAGDTAPAQGLCLLEVSYRR